MFRKPKRKIKALRPKTSEDDGKNEEQQVQQPDAADSEGLGEHGESITTSTTRELLEEARKRVKQSSTTATTTALAANATTPLQKSSAGGIMHTYNTSKENPVTAHDLLVVSTAEHHPAAADAAPHNNNTVSDGIFRNAQRNAFHAGPLRAAASVRVTARFDYQPDVCKDYKDTGFCGFGDTCIYLHDRGDTLTGWQLDQQWEQEQKAKREQQQREMQDYAAGKPTQHKKHSNNNDEETVDDGLPFACHLCREPFKNPVVTACGHYFCEACIMNRVRHESEQCPICGRDTGSVFNQPTKLLAKKRRVLGRLASNADDSWEQYAQALSASTKTS